MKQNKNVISLGNLKLKNRYFLAPMHSINDIAFRILCKHAGAGLCYTELTSPESKAPIKLSDKPAIQFVTNRAKGIKEFIKKHPAPLYDLNLGCPSRHAKESKVGYFIHKDYKAVESVLSEIRKSTKNPITIKIRKMNPIATRKIIRIAEKYCDAIAVHARTCKQGYAGEPDIKYALKVKKLTKLPIIYSGNITNKQEADELLEKFDFVMIGRKSIGNPRIFSELTETKPKAINFNEYLKLAGKYKIDFHQVKLQAMRFTKGQKNSARKREKIVHTKSLSEIKKIIK